MVRGVPSRAAPELLRPGGARAARSPRALVVVILRTLSRLDDTRDGRALNYGDRHRVAGAHLRRILDDAGSRTTRLSAAFAGPAHLVETSRANLYPGRQCDAGVRVYRRRPRFPQQRPTRFRLRPRRHRHDARHVT